MKVSWEGRAPGRPDSRWEGLEAKSLEHSKSLKNPGRSSSGYDVVMGMGGK